MPHAVPPAHAQNVVQGCLFDDSAADRAEALVAERASTPGLILCASLLENLPNLAGLCR
jgi:hypothetical protein